MKTSLLIDGSLVVTYSPEEIEKQLEWLYSLTPKDRKEFEEISRLIFFC